MNNNELKLEITCGDCGERLDSEIEYGVSNINIKIDSCPECLYKAITKGNEQGYDEGYDTGYNDGVFEGGKNNE